MQNLNEAVILNQAVLDKYIESKMEESSMSKEPEVVLIAQEDWANAAFNLANALREVGTNAVALSKKPMVSYDKQAKIYFKPEYELYPICAKAKWVIWMHSAYTPLPDEILNNRSIKFAVFHGGTMYRNQSEICNKIFDPKVDLVIIQTLEMWDLCNNNSKVQLIPPVDTSYLTPDFQPNEKTIVAHYPRHPLVKGSNEICKAVEMLQAERDDFEFRYSEELCDWEHNMMRIMDCDIYIEQIGTGYWSVTAMEAAALGKVVLASFDHWQKYCKHYNLKQSDLGIHLVEKDTLSKVLGHILNNNLTAEKMKSHNWVVNNHSYKATGSRFKKLLNL